MHNSALPFTDEAIASISMGRPRSGSIASLANINGGNTAALTAVLDDVVVTTVSVVPADEGTGAALSLGEKLGHLTRTADTVATGDAGTALITEKLKAVLLPTVAV